MDASSWLRKQLEEASPDLLRAMVKEFAEALMGAERGRGLRRRLRRALAGAGQPPQRLSRARLGHAGRLDRARGAEAARGQVLPRLAAAAAPAGGAGVRVGDRRRLPGRRLDPPGGEAGAAARGRADVEEPGLAAGEEPRPDRRGLPHPPARRCALPVRDPGRAGGQVPRGRPHGQRLRRARRRRQPGRLPRVARPRRRHRRGRRRLARLPPLAGRRGLAGVKLVSSDAHPGLVDAIAATLPGACWQRCRTHFMRNLLTRVPKSAQSFVATMVRTIFAQPDAATVREQHRRIVDQLETRFPEAAALLEEAAPTCSPSPASRRSTGGSSGATTRSSG